MLRTGEKSTVPLSKMRFPLLSKLAVLEPFASKVKLRGEIQTEFGSHVRVIDVGQDVPHILAVALHVAQIQWYCDGSMRHIDLAGVQQLNRPDQAAVGGGRRRSKVRQWYTRAHGRGSWKEIAACAGAEGAWTGSLVRVECT